MAKLDILAVKTNFDFKVQPVNSAWAMVSQKSGTLICYLITQVYSDSTIHIILCQIKWTRIVPYGPLLSHIVLYGPVCSRIVPYGAVCGIQLHKNV